jgi:hypothetical protein
VFVGLAEQDETAVPAGVEARVRALVAAGVRVRVERRPGDHLRALADASVFLEALLDFDRSVRSGVQ